MKKIRSKFVSYGLILVMLLGIVTNIFTQVNAEEKIDKEMMMGASGISNWDKDNNNLSDTDMVIIGNNSGDPVEWIRLNDNGLMLSKKIHGNNEFYYNAYGYYNNSTASKAMYSMYDSGLNFTGEEQKLVENTTLFGSSMYTYQGNMYNQKFFPLSIDEFNTYVGSGSQLAKSDTHSTWWLRSSRSNVYAYAVKCEGGDTVGALVTIARGIRPSFILDSDSILFTSPAIGGKNGSISNELNTISSKTTNSLKITAKDSNHKLESVVITSFEKTTSSFNIELKYSGASVGHMLSAMVIDKETNEIISYGNIASNISETDTVNVTLASDFDKESQKLVLFTETLNGDNKTDLASEMVEATMPSSATDITDFNIEGQVGDEVIDTTNHTVKITMPFASDITSIEPTITLSTGASLVPGSGDVVDFTYPVLYYVTAEDGYTSQTWTVSIDMQENPDIAIVNKAIETVEKTSYLNPINESDCIDETAIINYIKKLVEESLNDDSLIVTINNIEYIPAINGNRDNRLGTEGIIKYTVTINKGLVTSTTIDKELTIPAFEFKTLNVVEGNNQTITSGINNLYKFKIDGDISKFTNLYLDGKLVNVDNYSVKAGSVIIIVDSNYLNDLELGKHIFMVEFSNGEAFVNMEIIEQVVSDNENPSTGVSNNSMVYNILLFISLIAISLVGYKKFILNINK